MNTKIIEWLKLFMAISFILTALDKSAKLTMKDHRKKLLVSSHLCILAKLLKCAPSTGIPKKNSGVGVIKLFSLPSLTPLIENNKIFNIGSCFSANFEIC